jgi:pimeloyl-ACP methyl ester carboxylesterase
MVTDRHVDLRAGTFHYRDWGGKGRPLLLLHGAGFTARQWDMVAPILAQSGRVFAPDLRGHGESAKPDKGYDLDSEVDDVRQFAASLALEAPILVGHSWGASIALRYAAEEPDSCAGVGLVDGGLFESASFRTWEETEQVLKESPQLDGLKIDTFLTLARARYASTWSPEVGTILLANFSILSDGTIRSRLRPQHRVEIARANYNHKPSELYKHVRCPVLIVVPIELTGDKDAVRWNEHRTVSVAAAQQRLNSVQVVWLDGCSHQVPLERPKELAAAIQRFISSLRR